MGSGYGGSYIGTDGGSQPYAYSYSVEPHMHRIDIEKGICHDGQYEKNPTAEKIEDLINGNYIKNKQYNPGEVPYVIDMDGNIIIGLRNGNGREGLPTPHPTLIGGKSPEVRMAGMVTIRGGKIISWDNQSGHYKPNIKSMSVADEAFGKLPTTVFRKKRGGY
jgi:hypothetical protein